MTSDRLLALREGLQDWLSGKAYATNRGFYTSTGRTRARWSKAVRTLLGTERFLTVAEWLRVHRLGVPDDPKLVGEAVLVALASQAAGKARALARELAELERLQIELGVLNWPVALFVEEANRLARSLDRQAGVTSLLLKNLSKGGTPADGPARPAPPA